MQLELLPILLIQIALILSLSRLMGTLFARLHQPQVIGEMVAGILLGPSFLGWLWPEVELALFPPDSIPYLSTLSQVGVVFFLFLVGLELDPRLLRNRGRAALGISLGSIATPFVLGIALAAWMYRGSDLFQDPTHQHYTASLLFMGVVISNTAFAVLARVLTERNLHKSNVGAVSIAAAAANDVVGWCLLAVVVAVSNYSGPKQAVITALLAMVYVAFMLLAVRPALKRLEVVFERQGRLSQNAVAVIFLCVLASSLATEKIGIYGLFGAFLLGFVMPKQGNFVRHLSDKLQDFVVVLLLPIFFAYTGLNTRLTLLNQPALWQYALLIILIACSGKVLGAGLTARLGGFGWRDAGAIGWLMNTRGLVELVILGIGLQLGLITEALFAMLLVMALATAAMTSPMLSVLYPSVRSPAQRRRPTGLFSVLIPISLPKSAKPLARLADILTGPGTVQRRIYALYLRRPVDHEAYRSGLDEEAEPRSYQPLSDLLLAAEERGIPIEPISFTSRDVADDITAVARDRQVDLVLMGFHKPVIGRAILGGTVHRVLTSVPGDVAIFVDRGLHSVQQILVPFMNSEHGRLGLELAGRMARHTKAQVTVLHVVPPRRRQDPQGAQETVERLFHDPAHDVPVRLQVVESAKAAEAILKDAKQFDLVVIGADEEWGLESHLFGFRAERIARDCPTSLLIVRRGAGIVRQEVKPVEDPAAVKPG